VLLVSAATQHERDGEREHYTWFRFRRERTAEAAVPRPLWQHDKFWAGVLLACTLWMCWFFA
ncbi:MAG TPA: hypothetical protein VFW87_02370, partial [Pirellulales bacterium]|nr:hypothetical protein [Pirellulales bacterium]